MIYLSYLFYIFNLILSLPDFFCNFFYKRNLFPLLFIIILNYSFAVNAFVDVIRKFDARKYDFTLRETQTYEIIEDVAKLKSEIGILYTSSQNETIIMKLIRQNDHAGAYRIPIQTNRQIEK